MSRSKTDSKSTSSSTIASWRLASFRSHAVGATASLFVCAAIMQVYRFNAPCDTLEISSGVSVEEAIEVLRSADEWRSVHHEKSVLSEQLNASIDSLASWIPKTVDSDELETKLESLTQTTDTQLVSIAYQNSFVGSRVGVAVYTCHLRGSFSSIGRTLDAMTKLDHPIACDRISLSHRTDADTSNMTCDAIVSLRCPYAAEGTLAYRLLNERGHHGS